MRYVFSKVYDYVKGNNEDNSALSEPVFRSASSAGYYDQSVEPACTFIRNLCRLISG
jgi:hypothetical protein